MLFELRYSQSHPESQRPRQLQSNYSSAEQSIAEGHSFGLPQLQEAEKHDGHTRNEIPNAK